jgi:electron transfer flavoprotein beta subunit
LHVVIVTRGTPDTEAKVQVDASGKVTWGNPQLYMNAWDEYSVTEALILKENNSVKTTVLAVGPEDHNQALKEALARGIDSAIRIWDDSMEGQDSLGIATAIAAAIKKLGDVSLVIFGKEFVDTATDAHVFQVGRKLGWTTLGSVYQFLSVDFNANTVKLERMLEEGKQTVSTKLPAVIGVVQTINKPREATFRGIKMASKAQIPVWSSADLGIGNAASGAAAQTRVGELRNPPVRTAKVEIIDGASEQEKAEKLVSKLVEEKVV